jgi:phosphoribosylglycinamide formyltransferase
MADQCLITVMASGNGSNFQALIDAVSSNRIPSSHITRLIVNRKKAYAVTRAEKAGIPTEYFNLIGNGFQKAGEKDPEKIREARENYDAALAQRVLDSSPRPNLIVLAGWMHIFSRAFLDKVKGEGIEIINLHP